MTTSFPRRLACGAVAALLALGCASAHAQAVAPHPAPAKPPIPKNIAYYVDGKKVSQTDMASLQPDAIKSIDVVKSPADREKLGLSRETEGAVLITTQANANTPDVVAFNQRFPVQPATPAQNRAITAIQLYLRQQYPAAKVETVSQVPNKENRYQATYEENGKRWQLFFDGDGNVVPQ